MLKFRTLKPDEIECRVGTINEKGMTLLLYQNSRVAMDILDETVGPENWQRAHTRDNSNCIISIFNDKTNQWISKEDTGTESNTEKEKGLASDSFKRAAVNWGIGRELYTSPFIWLGNDKCNITTNTRSGKKECKDNITVKEIESTESKRITKLVLFNNKTNKICFTFNAKPVVESKPVESKGMPNKLPEHKNLTTSSVEKVVEQPTKKLISVGDMKRIMEEMDRVGADKDKILKYYNVKTLLELSKEQYDSCMNILKKQKTKGETVNE